MAYRDRALGDEFFGRTQNSDTQGRNADTRRQASMLTDNLGVVREH